MQKIQASVFIITKNEERNIQKCIQSTLGLFEEIIVIDSGSTDKTVEIAKDMGAIVYHQNWFGFAKQKQLALEKCTKDWVLNLDADETISREAIDCIKDVIEKDIYSGIEFRMYNYFCNIPSHPWTKHMSKIRFAKRHCVRFDITRTVHESMIIDGKIYKTKAPLYHFGENSIHTLVSKINDYSTLRAKNRKKIPLPCICGIFAGFFAFIKHYILDRNCLNGSRGFVTSIIAAFYAFLKRVKTLEN